MGANGCQAPPGTEVHPLRREVDLRSAKSDRYATRRFSQLPSRLQETTSDRGGPKNFGRGAEATVVQTRGVMANSKAKRANRMAQFPEGGEAPSVPEGLGRGKSNSPHDAGGSTGPPTAAGA